MLRACHLSPERKADLLATAVHRAFEVESLPPSATVRANVPGVIDLITEIAKVNRAQLRRVYR
jgi:hypothetical protein